jgi:long-chain acyl-CoA synthetase
MKPLSSLEEFISRFPEYLTAPFQSIEKQTIPDLVIRMAGEHPEQIAFFFEDQKITYGELDREINVAANLLKDLGVRPFDKVGILIRNCLEWVYYYFATQKNGAIVVPINTFYRERELEYVLMNSEAKVLVAGPEFAELIKNVSSRVKYLQNIFLITEEAPAGMTALLPRILELKKEKSHGRFGNLAKPWYDAVYFYTSGTTGDPKGVVLTHYSCLVNIEQVKEGIDLQSSDRFLLSTPLWHCAPSHASMLPGMSRGISFILERQFTPEILKAAEKHRATAMLGVPAMYGMLLQSGEIQKRNLSSMRFLVYGSAVMPFNTIKKLKELFPRAKLINGYGLTETSEAFTLLADEYALAKPGSVGRPSKGSAAKIVNDSGREVKPGKVGEIVCTGPMMMRGYYKKPEETEKSIRDNWLHTKDLGWVDEEGFLYIAGRKDDMINRGGENIFPAEIENAFVNHPEVLELAVVGVPDEIMGQELKAFVVKRPGSRITEEDVREICRRDVGKNRVPKHVQFLSALPKTQSGKVLKRELIKM